MGQFDQQTFYHLNSKQVQVRYSDPRCILIFWQTKICYNPIVKVITINLLILFVVGAPPPDHSGNKSWVSERSGNRQNFLSQRSPLFGQEFPSLESAAAAGDQDKKGTQQQQQQHQQPPNIYNQPPPSQPQETGPGKAPDVTLRVIHNLRNAVRGGGALR